MPHLDVCDMLVAACSERYVAASITDFVSLFCTLYIWEAESRRQIHRLEFDFGIEKLLIHDSLVVMIASKATSENTGVNTVETFANFFDISDGRRWSFSIAKNHQDHGSDLHLSENERTFFVYLEGRIISFDANGIVAQDTFTKSERKPDHVESMIFAGGELLVGVTYYSTVKRLFQHDRQRYEGSLLIFDENLHLKFERSLGITDARQKQLLTKHQETVVVCQRIQNQEDFKSRLLCLDGNSGELIFATPINALDGLYAEGIFPRSTTNLGLLCLIPYLPRPHPILCTINIANGTTTKDDIFPQLRDDEYYNHFFATQAVVITLRDCHSANLTGFRMIDMTTLTSSGQYEFVDS